MIPGDRRPTRWQCLEGLRKGCSWIGSGLPAAAIPCCPCVIAAASVLLNKKFSLLPKWGIGYPEKKPDPPPPNKTHPHTHKKKKANKQTKPQTKQTQKTKHTPKPSYLNRFTIDSAHHTVLDTTRAFSLGKECAAALGVCNTVVEILYS